MVQIRAGSLSRPLAENGKYGSAMAIAFANGWRNCQKLQAFSTRHTSKACRLSTASSEAEKMQSFGSRRSPRRGGGVHMNLNLIVVVLVIAAMSVCADAQ